MVQTAFNAEFQAIVQSSADAVVGLQAQGGPQLQNLAATIESVTQQFAGGDIQRAFGSLNELSGLLSSIPDLPACLLYLLCRVGGDGRNAASIIPETSEFLG